MRVGDALDGVRLAVRVVVGRVDAPGVARAWVGGVEDAVHHGVAQVDVGRRPCRSSRAARGAPSGNSPARMRARRSRFSSSRAVAPRAVPGPARSACRGARGSGRRSGRPRRPCPPLHQQHRPVVELLEVVGRVVEVLAPVEAEPAHVLLDGVDVLLLLLGRVRVVEAEVAAAAELLGDAEVQADRLRVAEVQVAVRLRREARDDGPRASRSSRPRRRSRG